MDIRIREERESDYDEVFGLIAKAFENMEESDHSEQFLVQRLRQSGAFVPGLSLVAEHAGAILGHILLTRILIRDGQNEFPSLALAPVSVLPEYQNRGIGGRLIQEAHKRAAGMGFASVILLGHADYYPRFGYKKASDYNIRLPFDVPDEYCMALELRPGALRGVSGTVEYPKEFFE